MGAEWGAQGNSPSERAAQYLALTALPPQGFRFREPYPDGDPGSVICRGCGVGKTFLGTRLALLCMACDVPEPTELGEVK
jgi:hypothetical protein